MNKKFSTLLAGMALVAAVSANAQTSIDVKNGKIDINTTAETLPKYDKDTKGGLYQLRDAKWSDLDDAGSEWRIFIGRKECQ